MVGKDDLNISVGKCRSAIAVNFVSAEGRSCGAQDISEGASAKASNNGRGRIVAWRAVEAVIDAGSALRLQDQVFFSDATDEREARGMRILRLVRAIRRERVLGCQGHWSYNPARHLALLQALRAEKSRSHVRS